LRYDFLGDLANIQFATLWFYFFWSLMDWFWLCILAKYEKFCI